MSLMGLGAASLGIGAAANVGNLYMQYKNYKYQKGLQKKMFSREDTATQRRIRDLRAAGLSPTLAAGGAAGAGAPIKVTPPQSGGLTEKALQAIALSKMDADISLTNAQKDLIEWQKRKATADTYKSNAEANIKSHDFSILKRAGILSTSGMLGKNYANAYQPISAGAKKIYKETQKGGMLRKISDHMYYMQNPALHHQKFKKGR